MPLSTGTLVLVDVRGRLLFQTLLMQLDSIPGFAQCSRVGWECLREILRIVDL